MVNSITEIEDKYVCSQIQKRNKAGKFGNHFMHRITLTMTMEDAKF